MHSINLQLTVVKRIYGMNHQLQKAMSKMRSGVKHGYARVRFLCFTRHHTGHGSSSHTSLHENAPFRLVHSRFYWNLGVSSQEIPRDLFKIHVRSSNYSKYRVVGRIWREIVNDNMLLF